MNKIAEVAKKTDDFAYFKEGSGAAIFGSPESCIRAIDKFRACGIDTLVMRIDSVPHDRIMKSIEMFGRHVIPHFKYPRNFMRPAEDVMADIRTMRDAAKAMGIYVEGEDRSKQAPSTRPRNSHADGPDPRIPHPQSWRPTTSSGACQMARAGARRPAARSHAGTAGRDRRCDAAAG